LGQSDSNVEHLCWGTAGAGGDEASSYKDSIVGRVIGGGDDSTRGRTEDDEDGQEPLALLVVHAVMHMLFLPQFTCEFFEENNDADLDADLHDDSASSGSDSMDSRPRSRKEKRELAKETKSDDKDGITEEEEEEQEAKKLAQQEEEEGDIFMKKEAGLPETRYIENGILLLPRPTTIVWAGGIGIKNNKVRMNCKSLLFHDY
jgi:hypothetical protein